MGDPRFVLDIGGKCALAKELALNVCLAALRWSGPIGTTSDHRRPLTRPYNIVRMENVSLASPEATDPERELVISKATSFSPPAPEIFYAS